MKKKEQVKWVGYLFPHPLSFLIFKLFMKIVVTGSTGHIGNNLVRRLLELGFEVTAIYRNPLKIGSLENLNCKKIQGNILDKPFLNKVFSDHEYVMHLAGIISVNGDPIGNVRNVNVNGTRNVVEASLNNNIKKLIHFSSIHALKFNSTTPIINEHTPLADSTCIAYDYSKALGELEILKGVKKGLDASIINPTAVLGPHDYWGSLQGDMLVKMFKGNMPALVSKGFDWVDVRDVVNAAIDAIEKGKSGEKYLIGGRWATPKEIAEICHQFSGKKPPKVILPIWVAMLGLPFAKLQSYLTNKPPLFTHEMLKILEDSNTNVSIKKAKTELNYKIRPLEETIEDTFEWFKSKAII
jgi:dihydroflavonol-4-reductase